MYAITVGQPGGPEALTWAEVPDPVAGYGEVVLDVAATAEDPADLMQRQGLSPAPAWGPATLPAGPVPHMDVV